MGRAPCPSNCEEFLFAPIVASHGRTPQPSNGHEGSARTGRHGNATDSDLDKLKIGCCNNASEISPSEAACGLHVAM
jgi:hypothetical protein